MSTAKAFDSEVAIIGIAGRFPQAGGVEEFWANLRDGVESIRALTEEDLRREGVEPELYNRPNYVRAKAVLADIDLFDAAFFGYSPREAEVIDPQHRLFLECAWEAFESAGYDTSRCGGPVGVFAGASNSGYILNLFSNREAAEAVGGFQVGIGNDKDHLPTRVSYKLDLRGPSVNVQTACSTSLVAVHLACQSLLSGDCDMALAGGATVAVPHAVGYLHQEGGITSPDGHCRAFDARAGGTVGGNGVAVVLLKRLGEALADGDQIIAVIKGSAVNNDGSQKVGYTAPGVEGQAAVIADALAVTGVGPESISYVEAHGTATALGDPIEVAALTQAFSSAAGKKKNYCALGSVKSNLGHLDAAAGAAGLIKTALALKHRLLPPSLHFERPNPKINFADSPFYVNAELAEWKREGDEPLRAGVSSFGIGGTNAHVILEEAPEQEPSGPSRPWQVLTLSARTETALEAATANLAAHLRRSPALSLADAAYTLHVGRRAFEHRRLVVCREAGEAAEALERGDPKRVFTARAPSGPRPVAFMFPGAGSQYPQMGRELYAQERVFREEFDRCAELLAPHTGFDLREALHAGGGGAEEAAQKSPEIALTLPALFAVEYALAKQLMAWGIRPDALIGHSVGEYTAACLAGVLSLEDALALVALRARLFASLPAGAMLSVNLAEADLRPLLGARASVAAVNAPALCVVSGAPGAIGELEHELAARGVESKRLHVGVAAHSPEVEPILGEFAEFVGRVRLNAPRIPYLSNVTGTWATPEEVTSPDYWVRHLRQTVRFAEGVRELTSEAGRILLEVGPGHALKMLASAQSPDPRAQVFVATMPHPRQREPEGAALLKAMGQLWAAGAPVAWDAFYADERRRRVPLPTYPFERRRYWVERRPLTLVSGAQGSPSGRSGDVAEWFYIPSWRHTMAPGPFRPRAERDGPWLVFSEGNRLSAEVLRRLEGEGQKVFLVLAGEEFERRGKNVYALNPGRRADYEALLGALRDQGASPRTVLHLWGAADAPTRGAGLELFEHCQEQGYYSLLFLGQALAEERPARAVRVIVVTSRAHEVAGEEDFLPERSTVLGPCKIIPQEFPHVSCRNVDIARPPADARRAGRLVEQLLAEAVLDSNEHVVAYRGGARLARDYQKVRLEEGAEPVRALRERGVYWIVGGLGRVGRQLAEYLARTHRARLVLTSRTKLPARDAWDEWLASHDEHDATSKKIRTLLLVEELGAEALVLCADATDAAQMRAAVEAVDRRYGALDGVFYVATAQRGGATAPLTEAGRELSGAMFGPRAAGLYVLEEVLRGREPDFCLLFSSNASVLGGLGFVTYASANTFVDAFAAHRNKTSAFPWISSNWDGWLNGDAGQRPADGIHKYSMAPAESAEALRRVLTRATVGQVVVSAGDLHRRLAEWVERPRQEGREAEAGPLHERPEVASDYLAPRNEVEEAVAEVWQGLLGIKEIGVRDDFFELGGHSLLATQVVARLRDAFGVMLPLRSLFENPTVEGLSACIEQVLTEEVAALDDEEAERLLRSEL